MRRKELGMTQEQLAFLAGINAKFLQRIEDGSSQPSAFNLVRLAQSLDTSPSALVDSQSVVRRRRRNEEQVSRMARMIESAPARTARLAVRIVAELVGDDAPPGRKKKRRSR